MINQFYSVQQRWADLKPLLSQVEKEQNSRTVSEGFDCGQSWFWRWAEAPFNRRDFYCCLLVSNKGQIVTGPAKSVSNGKSTWSDIGLPRNTLLQLDPSEKLNIWNVGNRLWQSFSRISYHHEDSCQLYHFECFCLISFTLSFHEQCHHTQ